MSTTTTTASADRITLYYREGSSDKVYQAAIEPSGSGFIVTFAYGRRGSTLTTGTKTPSPVTIDQARKVYDKLVRAKTTKGYSPGESGMPYQHTAKADRATGVLPQLCNPVDEARVEELLSDGGWWIQEKFDGRRVMIVKDGDAITGINRNGHFIDLPGPIVNAVARLGVRSCQLDGEALGDTFVAFDLLHEAHLDLRPYPYRERYAHLTELIDTVNATAIRYAPARVGEADKRAFLSELRLRRAEGIVFKLAAATHTTGRPASGGNWLKYKFTATASCIVAGTNGGKRSIRLDLIKDGIRVGVGSVTIPPRQPIPIAGQIVEVRYLYAYPGGALYQPVYLYVRDDVDPVDCTVEQLKLKAIEADSDVEA